MEFKIDYGTALAPRPADDGPMYASVAGTAFALGGEECVLRARGSGETHVMTVDVLDALDATRKFATVEAHAQTVAARLKSTQGRVDAVRPVLANLIERGLYLRDDAFLEGLAQSKGPNIAPPPLRAVFIRACDRPAQLAALLESLGANEDRHRGGHRYVVLDDSREPEHARAHAELVAQMAAKHGLDARHVDGGTWSAALEKWRRAVPHAAPAIDQLLAREHRGQPRPGGGKAFNLALLLGAGARLALLDDDFVLPVTQAPGVDGRLRLDPELEPKTQFFDTLPAALDAGDALDVDPFAWSADFCGHSLAAIIAARPGLTPGRDELRGLAPSLIGTLTGATRILMTANGHRGHSGSAGRDWLFLLDPAARAAFTRDREHYLATLALPSLGFSHPQLGLIARSVFTPFMLDASALLAPTAAVGRNEDYLFGAVNHVLWPDARTLATPHWMGHRQPVPKALSAPKVVADAGGSTDFIADWLVQRRVDLRGTDPARRLLRIADYLDDLATAPLAERTDLVAEYLSMRRADLIARLQAAFAAAPDAPIYWQADVRERIEVNGRALLDTAAPRLADWPPGLDRAASGERLAHAVGDFAGALAGWAALFEYARSRAERLLDDVR